MNDFNASLNATGIVPASHPLHGLATYLAELQAGRLFPRPREFDILACRNFVGCMHLADVIMGSKPPDCIFAVYGSRIANIIGHDYQGRRASDIADVGWRRHWHEILRRTLYKRAPEFMHDVARGPIRRGAPPKLDRLIWPMSSDGEAIDRILVGLYPI